MSLKTSFFNKTLVKSDFKRLWWIPALHTLAVFMMSVFRFMERYYNNPSAGAVAIRFAKDTELVGSTFHDYMIPAFVLACIVPVILGVFLFSYLQTQKASTFSHSIPVSRLSAFVSHTVSGILMFLIPLVINGLVLLVMRLDAGFAQTFKVSHLFGCMGIASLYSFVAFALSVIVSMITGNVLASFIFTYVFGVLPIAVEMFMNFFAHTQLYGYVSDTEYWCAEHLYLSSEALTAAGGITLYIIIGLVLLVAGYFLYRIRNVENHSSVVAFPALRLVFVFGAAICFGAIGFLYVDALWSVSNPFVMLPFGLVGLIIATMLVKKSFRGLKLLKPIIAYCLIIVCVYTIYNYDLTGFETRVPDSDDVEYVTFQSGINEYSGTYYSMDGKKYTYDETFSPDLTGDDAKAVIALHQYLTGEEKVAESFKNPWIITLSYKLKNGNELKRRYTIDYDEYKALLEPIVTTDTIRKTYFPVLRDDEKTYTRIEVRDGRISDDYLVAYSDEETMNEFIEALKKDTRNATYDEYAARNRTYTTVEVCYKGKATYEDGTEVPDENLMEISETYYIRPSYENTLALINERNLLRAAPLSSDIKSIGVEYYNQDTYEMVSYKEVKDINGWSFPVWIEDAEDIAEVYEYCKSGSTTRNADMMVMFFTHSGRHFDADLNSEDEDLPDVLKPFVYMNK